MKGKRSKEEDTSYFKKAMLIFIANNTTLFDD